MKLRIICFFSLVLCLALSCGVSASKEYTCPSDFPVDCGNYYCCPESHPICLYGPSKGKCTQCGASLALNNDETKLNALRTMRDSRMTSTVLGKFLISLYYEHTNEISAILLADEYLQAIAADVVEELAEKTVLLNHNEEAGIDQELVDSILDLADLINENASPNLRKAIKRVKKTIKKGTIFKQLGITISE